jgi:cellulose synthase/poly-beta-1,6-N-acetylglucosamine synthase-like glycosyltransferase
MMYAQHMQAHMKELRVSRLIRQAHRWLSLVFTATVIANFVAMSFGVSAAWVVYSPLPPLFLMLLTGLYMFVLPYLPNRERQAERRKCRS